MEMLSWMKKVDMTMDKLDLLYLIDNMHEVIDAFLIDSNKKDHIINELRAELEKNHL